MKQFYCVLFREESSPATHFTKKHSTCGTVSKKYLSRISYFSTTLLVEKLLKAFQETMIHRWNVERGSDSLFDSRSQPRLTSWNDPRACSRNLLSSVIFHLLAGWARIEQSSGEAGARYLGMKYYYPPGRGSFVELLGNFAKK